ncbi:MAG: dihydrolipoyllysine-residue succinyltransferase, partial [Bacteriovoracales bacterium]|nr:dihydrolipoyllysine-residue succinyltransferase [Bacteriovoracales bacterium]
MTLEVKVPSVGESISEVTVANWIKKTGESVELDGPICEIESDKATVELLAEANGVLDILIEEGETVAVGTVIAKILPQEPKDQRPKAPAPPPPPPPAPPFALPPTPPAPPPKSPHSEASD